MTRKEEIRNLEAERDKMIDQYNNRIEALYYKFTIEDIEKMAGYKFHDVEGIFPFRYKNYVLYYNVDYKAVSINNREVGLFVRFVDQDDIELFISHREKTLSMIKIDYE